MRSASSPTWSASLSGLSFVWTEPSFEPVFQRVSVDKCNFFYGLLLFATGVTNGCFPKSPGRGLTMATTFSHDHCDCCGLFWSGMCVWTISVCRIVVTGYLCRSDGPPAVCRDVSHASCLCSMHVWFFHQLVILYAANDELAPVPWRLGVGMPGARKAPTTAPIGPIYHPATGSSSPCVKEGTEGTGVHSLNCSQYTSQQLSYTCCQHSSHMICRDKHIHFFITYSTN